jgi:hypothetical protein
MNETGEGEWTELILRSLNSYLTKQKNGGANQLSVLDGISNHSMAEK